MVASSRHRSSPMRGGGRPIASSSYNRRKQQQLNDADYEDYPQARTRSAEAAAAAASARSYNQQHQQQLETYAQLYPHYRQREQQQSSSSHMHILPVSSPTALTHSVPRPRSPRSPRSAAAARRRDVLNQQQQQQQQQQRPLEPTGNRPTGSRPTSNLRPITPTRTRAGAAVGPPTRDTGTGTGTGTGGTGGFAEPPSSLSVSESSATGNTPVQMLLSAERFSQEVHSPRLVSSMGTSLQREQLVVKRRRQQHHQHGNNNTSTSRPAATARRSREEMMGNVAGGFVDDDTASATNSDDNNNSGQQQQQHQQQQRPLSPRSADTPITTRTRNHHSPPKRKQQQQERPARLGDTSTVSYDTPSSREVVRKESLEKDARRSSSAHRSSRRAATTPERSRRMTTPEKQRRSSRNNRSVSPRDRPRRNNRSTSPRDRRRNNRSVSPRDRPRRRRDDEEDDSLLDRQERDRDRDRDRDGYKNRSGSSGRRRGSGTGTTSAARNNNSRGESTSRGRGERGERGTGGSRSSSSRKSRRGTPTRGSRDWRATNAAAAANAASGNTVSTRSSTQQSSSASSWRQQQQHRRESLSQGNNDAASITSNATGEQSLETGLRGLLRGGRLMGSRMVECVHVAANVYSQECHAVAVDATLSPRAVSPQSEDNAHGDDALFFQNYFKSQAQQQQEDGAGVLLSQRPTSLSTADETSFSLRPTSLSTTDTPFSHRNTSLSTETPTNGTVLGPTLEYEVDDNDEEDDINIRIFHPNGPGDDGEIKAVASSSPPTATADAAAATAETTADNISAPVPLVKSGASISTSNTSHGDRTEDLLNPHHHSHVDIHTLQQTLQQIQGNSNKTNSPSRPPPILLNKTRGLVVAEDGTRNSSPSRNHLNNHHAHFSNQATINENDSTGTGEDQNQAAASTIDSRQSPQQQQHDLSKVLPLSRTGSELRDLRALRLQMFAHDITTTSASIAQQEEQEKQQQQHGTNAEEAAKAAVASALETSRDAGLLSENEILLHKLQQELAETKAAVSNQKRQQEQQQRQAHEKAQQEQSQQPSKASSADARASEEAADFSNDAVNRDEAAFRRQVHVQEKLRRELQNNDKLLDQISGLKEETMRLKNSLRTAKADARRAEIRASSPTAADTSRTEERTVEAKSSSPNRPKSILLRRPTPVRSLAATPPKRRPYKEGMKDDNSPTSVMDGPFPSDGEDSSRSRQGSKSEKRSPETDRSKDDSSSPQREQQQDGDDNVNDDAERPVYFPEQYLMSTSSEQQPPELLAMKAEVIDLRAQLAEAHATRLAAEHRTAELERDNQQVRTETRQLRAEVAELKRLVQDLTTAASSTSGPRAIMDDELESVRQQLSDTEKMAADYSLEKEKLQKDLDDTRNEAETLRLQLARFLKNANGKEQAELEKQVKCMTEKNEKLDEELNQARTEADKLRLEVVHCKNEISEAQQHEGGHTRKLQEEVWSMKKTRTALELRYKQQIGRFINDIDKAKQDAEAKLKSKDQEARKLEAEVLSAKVTKDRLEEELALSQNEGERLRSDAARLMKQLKSKDSLRQAVQQMKDEKVKLEEELTETQTEASRLKSDVARFMEALEKSEHQRQAGDERMKISDEESRKLQVTVREMKDKLAKSNAEVVQQASEHLKQRQMIEEELTQTQQASQALLQKVVCLDDQIVRAESEADRLRNILETQESEQAVPTFSESISRTFSDVAGSLSARGSSVGDGGKMVLPEGGIPKNMVINRLRGALESYHHHR